jgi:outer membrane protein OmpA-like peptidoglycan-associated protein
MKTLASTVLLLAALAGSGLAAGQASTPAYLVAPSAGGAAVTDSSGNCVRTLEWTAGIAFEHCGRLRTLTIRSDALFAFNSAFVKGASQETLEKLAERLGSMRSVEGVEIVGHTDNVGSPGYNQRLSERRAVSTRQILIKHGIDPAKISILGMGERAPVADNETPEGRAKNRRVVIMFKGVPD